jgi:DNA ligase (NAD+)
MFKLLEKLFASGASAEDKIVFHPSQTCPECGSRLMHTRRAELREAPSDSIGTSQTTTLRDDAGWSCPNPDCPAQIRRGLLHWCSPEAMNIPGIDEPLVALLVNHGLVRDVAELYRAKPAELAALPGMDPATAQRIFDAITASKGRGAYCVLRGLDIALLGKDECTALVKHFSNVDIALSAGASRLIQAGLSEAAAQNVIRWYGDSINRKLLKRLEKFGVNLKTVFVP